VRVNKVWSCLVTEHDFKLVVVAAIVCFAACFTAFRLYGRMQGSRGTVRAAWLVLAGLVSGSGIWATHFVGMVAFQPGLPTGYSPGGTLLSLMIAVIFTSAGFGVALAQRTRSNDLAGGMIIGFGIGAMHYAGMSAFVTQGVVVWEGALVGLSIMVGVAGSVAALVLCASGRRLKGQLTGAGLLCLAVCGLHFTGMGAVTIVPDPSVIVPPQLLSGGVLTLAVISITSLIILGGLGVVAIESQTTRSALERIRRLANAAYEGIVVVQNGKINDANAAFCELVGERLDDLRGKALFGEILTLESDVPLSEGVRREGLLTVQKDARDIPVEVFSRLMDDGARLETNGLTVLAVRDLRERRSAEEQIRYLAEHDSLTGLPNRNSLQTRLNAALERVEASGERLAVMCIDLDHFKEANDQHGHLAGDAVLVETAKRLQQSVAAPSFAARLGGDEFIIVLVGEDDHSATAELATNLLETLSAPVPFAEAPIAIGASLGISLFPDDGRTAQALIANADMALYRAKQSGRGAYQFFKREMDESIRARRTLARELKQGIAEGQLVVFYQPLARASDGQVCGFEALVRWNHPVRGMVPPLDFIPVAEESGLIAPLGEWVLRRACADAAAWDHPLRIAVNLSPHQLNDPELPSLVHEVLIQTGLTPSRLELEVTETALFKDYQRALDNLRRLKALGVRIAMDDFGTGFSSLSTLQSFQFDKIKIDKSFVETINMHGRGTVIVRAVLGLGRSLEIPVVAEGVETQEQIDFLRQESCTELQGYAIGRPAPLQSIGGWTSGPQSSAFTQAPIVMPKAVKLKRA
jgi:diguanylate cyclase (GGDEF)-like protein